MNEVTLAVAAKVSFCSGILRFLTPGLTYIDLINILIFQKGESGPTLLVQLGLEDWLERMDRLLAVRRICRDLHLGFSRICRICIWVFAEYAEYAFGI